MRINLREHRLILALAGLTIITGAIALNVALQPAPAQPSVSPAPQPAPSAPVAPVATAPTDPILDLFQPSEASLQQQLSTTQLSEQIENAMVVSYTLVRCNLLSEQEYTETFRALIIYATRSQLGVDAAQSEAKVRAIAEAASASYAMVYSNANCADPTMAEKVTALKQWRDSIMASATTPPAP